MIDDCRSLVFFKPPCSTGNTGLAEACDHFLAALGHWQLPLEGEPPIQPVGKFRRIGRPSEKKASRT
jgi:hypothetical protein